MIHIVHVISGLEAGGAEMMLAKLVRSMDRDRFSNVVISLTGRGVLGQELELSGIPVYSLGMTRGWVSLLALPRLIALLRRLRPTIVQSWLYHADLLSTVAIQSLRGSALVWNVRCSDMDLTRYRRLTRWVQWALARLSGIPSVVIVNSESGQRVHEDIGYRPSRWEVIPNGFDLIQFHPDAQRRVSLREEWQIPPNAVVVGLIARVDPMKDHATFLAAAQEVAASGRDVRFILVGGGTETLLPAVSQRGLAERVYLLGYRKDVATLLPAMDVVCLSSEFGEGFPNVLGEAMACGIPCVSTDVGDVRKIIGETGHVVPVRNPPAFARAIIELIDEGPLGRQRLGSAARLRIETTYSLSQVVRRYMNVYEGLQSSARAVD